MTRKDIENFVTNFNRYTQCLETCLSASTTLSQAFLQPIHTVSGNRTFYFEGLDDDDLQPIHTVSGNSCKL